MADALQKARDRFMAADYKKAVSLLWEVTPDDDMSARAVLDLTAAMHDRLTGSLRSQCESLASRATVAIESSATESTAERVAALTAEFAKDPALLARRAAEAGLRWLKIQTEEDDLADSQKAAISAWAGGDQSGQPKPCLIDAVEAEGWTLEQTQDLFVPTAIQTSLLTGAYMGGEPVSGRMCHVYLFRRSPQAGSDTPAH
jgi:hypothetical protein